MCIWSSVMLSEGNCPHKKGQQTWGFQKCWEHEYILKTPKHFLAYSAIKTEWRQQMWYNINKAYQGFLIQQRARCLHQRVFHQCTPSMPRLCTSRSLQCDASCHRSLKDSLLSSPSHSHKEPSCMEGRHRHAQLHAAPLKASSVPHDSKKFYLTSKVTVTVSFKKSLLKNHHRWHLSPRGFGSWLSYAKHGNVCFCNKILRLKSWLHSGFLNFPVEFGVTYMYVCSHITSLESQYKSYSAFVKVQVILCF